MPRVNRQSNLFAAEDWTIAYKAYSEVNFQAYDFDTIRTALVQYIRVNFPENFNDYIDSSEMIAIIELLAYLSQSLSFRMDINSRENFLETAERRDSVFKLARMLGYNPKRNVPASGLMKITSVKTNESLKDSLGTPLNNKTIFWDDANNAESYEQFLIVINSAMNEINRFTSPIKSGTVAGIQTELYRINSKLGSPLAYPFTLNVNGRTRTFETVNVNFTDGGVFFEMHPDPLDHFGFLYRNDGKGISSDSTGFFTMFKQGILTLKDYNYINPVPNRIEDLLVRRINETDFWVQEINTTGSVLNKWEQVANTIGQTLNYNSKALGTRNLYSIENLNQDGIRVRYPDGNFGEIPVGIFRTYYRTSDGERYQIQPDDARNIIITIPYQNREGKDYALTLSMSLRDTVSNSLPEESLANIKQNAPQTYYTQNRMVSRQDYNVFPFAQSTNIEKLRSINRTHAGHSRFIDINDPTGTFQNVNTFADDGSLYKEDNATSTQLLINASNTTREVISNKLPLLLRTQTLNNFVYDGMRKEWIKHVSNKFDLSSLNVRWKPLPTEGKSATGYMTETTSDTGNETNIMINTLLAFKGFQENNFIKYVNPGNLSEFVWVRIISVTNDGSLTSSLSTSVGPWMLSAEIHDNWRADEVITTLRKVFTQIEEQDIKTKMDSKNTFGLGYDVSLDDWYVIENKDLDKRSKFNIINAKTINGSGADASWLLLLTYTAIDDNNFKYVVTSRGEQYVIQSKSKLKFYNISNIKVSGKSNSDKISITTLNTKPSSVERLVWDNTAWNSVETGSSHIPNGFATNIPLRTRDTSWTDVGFSWKDNFGLYRGLEQSVTDILLANTFVNEATIPINTYFNDEDILDGVTPNVTIANNTGVISGIPSNIIVSFNNTTFGYNIFSSSGNVIYKDFYPASNQVEVFQANVSGDTKSFGVSGLTYNDASVGRIVVANANIIAQTGNLIITNNENNKYTYVVDSTLKRSQSSILLDYKRFNERLDKQIDWHVVDNFKYNDGYTDPRKIQVAPLDNDGDLVPDRPLQFDEFVDKDDLVLFEYYTDFDGYTYDRPISVNILDLRKEDSIVVDFIGDTIGPGRFHNPTVLSNLDWIMLKRESLLPELENEVGKIGGLIVYAELEDTIWQFVPSSTDINSVRAVVTTEFIIKRGRGLEQNKLLSELSPMIFKWEHVASKDVRIDPSISNVVEMLILTKSYYSEVQKYINVSGTSFPESPTSKQLANEFEGLNEFKNASDSLVFRSAKIKLLFGSDADDVVQAKFRIVRLNDNLSDNELKSAVIRAINTYFSVDNWEFGETFYFTEMATFIHQQLGSAIGSIIIVPNNSTGTFGDLFQVKAESDELFVNTAKTSDIEIISKITSETLRVDR